MRTKKFNRSHAVLVFALLLLVGYLSFLSFLYSPKGAETRVTLLSPSNFEFSDLMRMSDP